MSSEKVLLDEAVSLDSGQVLVLLPHRYPFLLVDRVIAVERGNNIQCVKNVAITEPYLQGHFPNRPLMPGVLIMEALAQTCGILTLLSEILKPGSAFYFVGIDKGRFRKPVIAGDQIILKANVLRSFKGIWKFETRAEVDGDEVASAQMMIAPEANS
jgi:3-hydroxyacyl-[acyl-carrier-protein] dehydratase